jgi:hypothetical protein
MEFSKDFLTKHIIIKRNCRQIRLFDNPFAASPAVEGLWFINAHLLKKSRRKW